MLSRKNLRIDEIPFCVLYPESLLVNPEKMQFIEYVADHGTYDDVPLQKILSAWEKAYGKDRVRKWIRDLKKSGDKPEHNFDKEDVVKD